MTITYDPSDPAYWDEPDLRDEMTRVFDLCHGCRMCFKLCPAFPSLFEMIDEFDDQDAARMTPAQQDRVVDECFNCKLCYVICPYIPGQSEWELDFPRLMLRAEQVRHRNERQGLKAAVTTQALGRTDLAGKANTALAPLANKAIGTPGSTTRRLMEKTVGIAAERLLPPYARQRFSTWFDKRRRAGTAEAPAPGAGPRRERAVLFPTCIVEYQAPEVGHDLVKVCERNGVSCELPEGEVCCGAPWLHAGDVDRFVQQGAKNVAVLAEALRRAGPDATVVVPQPTCSYVLKKDYVDYVGGPDAELVAERT
ncbi:MAG: 4Fe-4S dicluster domain-containing protein, partial [Acidimicrobiales bacterium]|nr:4Fe-4S dicluster domain-containing protein [Acidimicrobiales bacterium]